MEIRWRAVYSEELNDAYAFKRFAKLLRVLTIFGAITAMQYGCRGFERKYP